MSLRSRRRDHDLREARKRSVNERHELAEELWSEAMRAHRLAPPDLGFSDRLRALAEAAAAQASVARDAHELGLQRMPFPEAEHGSPPYELRPEIERPGQEFLWRRFDDAAGRLNHAGAGADLAAWAEAHAQLSAAALALADAIDAEHQL
jgi:hypothetical protein